jgi:2-C-methyl-D-erythritol 4-phosphate cytidylyltransferase
MNTAIIVAAGQGERMNSLQAKQFLELAGTPIIIHTLKRFEQCEDIHELIVVLPSSDVDGFQALTEQFGMRRPVRAVAGGGTRSESVWRGLQSVAATPDDIIVVHDGVRPFVTVDEIRRTIHAAEESGAAILVAPASDTIKEIRDDKVKQTIARAYLRRALTPQCFRYDLLRRAYERSPNHDNDATDCSVLVERLGEVVTVVEGSSRNIKITCLEDLAYGEILLEQETGVRMQEKEVRIQKPE